MGQTICEKIIAKAAGLEKVIPGEYVILKDFVGPIAYSFRGVNLPAGIQYQLSMIGVKEVARPERIILNCDHNTPPQSIEDVLLIKSVREKAAQMGIQKVYTREGIGHVVNVEKGEIVPGVAFVHIDPQGANAGGIGAFYTNGGRLGSTVLEAFATGEITICVPGTIKIEINGKLSPFISSRDVWFKVLNEIGPDGAFGMVLEFSGSTIDDMRVEERMVLCGNNAFAGSDGAIIQSDAVTQEWFKDNFGIEVEQIQSDPDAAYAKVFKFAAEEIELMVTYPPEIYTCKPAREFSNIKINQCILGTCGGAPGRFKDGSTNLKG